MATGARYRKHGRFSFRSFCEAIIYSKGISVLKNYYVSLMRASLFLVLTHCGKRHIPFTFANFISQFVFDNPNAHFLVLHPVVVHTFLGWQVKETQEELIFGMININLLELFLVWLPQFASNHTYAIQ